MSHLDVEKINQQRIEAYREIDRLEQELATLTKKHRTLQKRFDTQVETIISTRSKRDEYRSGLHRANKSLEKLRARLASCTAENGSLRFQLNSFKEQLKHARRELGR